MNPTPQQIFDKTARHLLKQGKKAQRPLNPFEPDGPLECAYRAPDGCKCAAGVHIPDNDYDPAFEGRSVRAMRVIQERLAEGIPTLNTDNDGDFALMWERNGFNHPEQFGVLTRLQQAHDLYDPHEWPHALSEVAKRFALSPAVLDEVIS